MKKVIDWVKANVLIVVLGAVALLSLGLGAFFAGSLNESVQKTAKERAAKMGELASLEKSAVTLNIPGREPTTKTVVINEQLLAQYREATEQLKGDADKIKELALARNQRDHKPVLDGIFPTPPSAQRELVPSDLQKALDAAYKKLFTEVNAGAPPSSEKVIDALARRESQYIQSTLRKANREALDEREKKDLTEDLSSSRLAIYDEQAQKLTFYMAPSAIQIPPTQEGRAAASMAEMFDWQWRYWIVRDILHAVADASEAATGRPQGSVLKSPVKRILSVRVDPADFVSSTSGSGGGGGGGAGFGGMGFGSATSDPGATAATPAPEAGAANQPVGSPQVDMATEAGRDFTKSLTGRQRSSAYDVRRTTVQAIVATGQLPQFFDALAKRNFITVTNVRIQQADPFAEADQGFLYGKDPVSIVTMDLESVWLRAWLAPLMPTEVRTALGIPNLGAADSTAAPKPSAG